MRKRSVILIFSLIALFGLSLTALAQATIINLRGGESIEINCEGNKLNLTRLSATKASATCKGSNSTPVPSTPTPVPPTPESPTPTPTFTPAPPPPGGYSETFPEVAANILGNCPAAVHDRYAVIGPNGLKYRTWHPITVPIDPANPNGASCSFAHEHGDPPHPDAPLPPFGYAASVQGMISEIAAHPGFKLFTHYRGNLNGFGRTELDYGNGLDIDFMVTIHQGTAGRGRLTIQNHSLDFWSRDEQGRITQIYSMADTGPLRSKCNESFPGRNVVSRDCPTYETWSFGVNIGGVWNSGQMFAAVTNPMNHMVGDPSNPDSVQLVSTSETLCGPNFGECNEKLPFGDSRSLWLGHFRTIHEPDWEWRNQGGEEVFCTSPMGGAKVACGPGTIQQRVATINASNAGARILDRTPNSQGWDAHMGPLSTMGAPGGN
jgi:hypothetical protein